jgi:hypothetical protein
MHKGGQPHCLVQGKLSAAKFLSAGPRGRLPGFVTAELIPLVPSPQPRILLSDLCQIVIIAQSSEAIGQFNPFGDLRAP